MTASEMDKVQNKKIILSEKAPLFEALSSFAAAAHTSFHMPGSRAGVPAFSLLDVTELPETDDLNDPQGPVLEAQARAAKFFGAEQTRFLTEGSSQGIFASVLALAGFGGKVLFPRAVHRAFMYAAQRFGLDVCFAMPSQSDLPCPSAMAFTAITYPSLTDYERQLKTHPDICLVVATAPDYYGYIGELEGLERLCQKYGVRLLVDAAHGAHLHLLSNWRLYGDIVIESAHKTLPSVTPSAFLHICEKADRTATAALTVRIDTALRLLRTSSPPLYVAAAADWARAFLEEYGLASLTWQKVFIARLRLDLPKNLVMLSPLAAVSASRLLSDPLRIVIDVSYYMSGRAMAGQLAERGIQVEFADPRSIVLIPSMLSKPVDYEHLAEALKQITSYFSKSEQGKGLSSEEVEKKCIERQESLSVEAHEFYRKLSGFAKGQKSFLSGKALKAALQRELRGLAEPHDEALIPYPPGIPMYWPTEVR